MDKKDILEKIAKRLRIHSLKMTTKAGSGHPTTCLSAAEIAACLFFDEMRYNPQNPMDESNDEFVLSKGHAAPLLWAVYAEAGIIPQDKLKTLRHLTSNLEGHPTPRMKWVKAATGSLGQGLSVGVGMALAAKMRKSPARVFVLMGDGECAEGAVWEAANAAASFDLDNLTAIVDINRLGQSDATFHGHQVKAYERKFKAFGWDTVSIDGNKIEAVLEALKKAAKTTKPAAVLAKTIKGKGVPFIEDLNGWHGKPLSEEDLARALKILGPMPEVDASRYVKKPRKTTLIPLKKNFRFSRMDYTKPTATRRAYGNALASLGKVNTALVVLDGDVKNSTYAETFMKAYPKRSFQLYIAEQNMAGMAIGLSAKGFIPFAATFSAFWSRAHDQIRMAAYSMANIKFVGSHSGVSIGADGPSQMGLEDMAMFRPLPGCVVLYPCDAPSTESCFEMMARHKGLSYLRTTRPATQVLYDKKEKFPIGGSKILRSSRKDSACVIAAGITVHEALKAYEELKKEDIFIRIIDAYSIQPLDTGIMRKSAAECGNKIVVAEDHFASGGLGEAVAISLAGEIRLIHLAVRELPRSGKPEELLHKYGIDADHIKNAVKKIMGT
ncbi:MAG: transketolase [Candidatus Aminicenantes bacterium]|nr:transketolase [Candidatus Aminicenantes bacterium]